MLSLHLVIRFALELCALLALGFWGLRTAGWALAIAAPLLAATFWWLFVAPKARVATPPPVRELLALVVFAVAGTALYAAGEPLLALIFAVVAVVNSMQLRLYAARR